MKSASFDVEFEDEILAQCLRDKEYLKSATRVLDVHVFSTKEHGWLWKTAKEAWTKHKELLTPKIVALTIKRDFSDKDVKKQREKQLPYVEVTKRIIALEPTAPRATLDELAKFVRHVQLHIAMEEGVKALARGDVDAAYSPVKNAIARDIRPSGFKWSRWMEEFDDRLATWKHRKEHPEDFVRIPTGLPTLDGILGGGIQQQEIGLILATTGRGKSIALVNLAYQAITHKHPTIYFALEMGAEQVAMRFDSRFTAVEHSKFKTFDIDKNDLEEIAARRAKMEAKLRGMLRICSMPIRKADINSVRNAVDEARDEMGGLSLIIMDSGDHLQSVIKYKDIRIEQAQVYWDMKDLAEELDVAIWSSTHAGRDWADRIATAESVNESYDKARIADIVASLNKPLKKSRATTVSSDDEEETSATVPALLPTADNTMEMFLAKYRDGASHIRIQLETDFKRMLITEASAP